MEQVFPQLWIFATVFIIAYIPISTAIGYWHRKTQLKIETSVTLAENPIMARYIRVLLDVQTGKATEEEIEKLRKFLKKIEAKL